MGKILKTLSAVMIMMAAVSCGTYYQQIARVSSPNVKMADERFSYSSDNITITYDFWSVGGEVLFSIENKTGEDIILDLSRSFFILNGEAYDYFRNRVRVYELTEQVLEISTFDKQVYEDSRRAEYAEPSEVTIPAHSKKTFGEYNVTDDEYIQCGFIRNPRGREVSILDFESYTSPWVIENRLMLEIDEQDFPITNSFYISELQNIIEDDVVKTEQVTNCKGRSSDKTVKINIMAAPNRFYIPYKYIRSEESGRTR